jgi:hypothetical protein
MGQAELILVMPVVVKAPSKRRRRLRRTVFIGLSLPRNRTARRGKLQEIRRGYQVPYRGRRDDFAFTLCASAFSGFYLPLMALVWLLNSARHCDRVPNQIQNAAWERLWDVVFSASSALVVISFGAALGNRGSRPAPRSVGPFLSSVLEQFSLGPDAGILDGYTPLVAASAFLTLAQHGALWLAFKTEGTLELRAWQAARGPGVGRARLRRRYHRGELPGRASPGREFSRASLADSYSPC